MDEILGLEPAVFWAAVAVVGLIAVVSAVWLLARRARRRHLPPLDGAAPSARLKGGPPSPLAQPPSASGAGSSGGKGPGPFAGGPAGATDVGEETAVLVAGAAAGPATLGAEVGAVEEETESSTGRGAGELDVPEPPTSRMTRLRARLAGSKSVLGRALLQVLSRDRLNPADWDEFEETLLLADVGVAASEEILDAVREAMRVEGASADPAATLRRELLRVLEAPAGRAVRHVGEGRAPGVVLVVGVNGSGKTTTIGRLARLVVAEGNTALLGAADTFRAAAADQLATWGARVGVPVVRGGAGADPASVAFDAVARGIELGVDTVIIDTAGRLHNKANLMAELGKIKRVASKRTPITETLLVLDATTGQNGLAQARVFTEVVDVTGIVLTKLDGTAKGGIVIAVQKELGVPVKLVGLGEGPDDLAPFDPELFVDGLLA
ncbi:MAG: signal recognition particle-docking protein FtsY [Bifidobacteriaceae bacterium]|jgi:fused signal recognition particle receptor|nr:signal recognition particle-docking protein FtsY [Bifidobacteriaceae bacterium]